MVWSGKLRERSSSSRNQIIYPRKHFSSKFVFNFITETGRQRKGIGLYVFPLF